MKKQTISILICLAVFSLACLQTAMPSAVRRTAEPVDATATEADVVSEDFTLTPAISLKGEGEPAPQICAEVTAARSVNLRGDASEHARWLMWLLRGDQVVVIDQSNADWWKVEINGLTGYVRSAYVGERECE